MVCLNIINLQILAEIKCKARLVEKNKFKHNYNLAKLEGKGLEEYMINIKW